MVGMELCCHLVPLFALHCSYVVSRFVRSENDVFCVHITRIPDVDSPEAAEARKTKAKSVRAELLYAKPRQATEEEELQEEQQEEQQQQQTEEELRRQRQEQQKKPDERPLETVQPLREYLQQLLALRVPSSPAAPYPFPLSFRAVLASRACRSTPNSLLVSSLLLFRAIFLRCAFSRMAEPVA